eukprot:TRINITY_DN121231_c0_g1_i1.p1 TRINITY_DN121231_c0_g1~~TRINITY_DN121231_c0_g1_i1.p1  ORF type:complete len:598 (-),score=78.00 TRINITY_DN121231_c0_g1_i1:735-2528(-)
MSDRRRLLFVAPAVFVSGCATVGIGLGTSSALFTWRLEGAWQNRRSPSADTSSSQQASASDTHEGKVHEVKPPESSAPASTSMLPATAFSSATTVAAAAAQQAASGEVPCIRQQLGLQNIPQEWCFFAGAESCAHRDFPLTAEVVEHGLVHGDTAALAMIFQKIRSGERVNIMELGGSFTTGEGCHSGETSATSCAWPARVYRWLQKAFPQTTFAWWHKARRSTTSAGFLTGLGPLLKTLPDRPDIVFLDLLINDAKEPMRGLRTINVSKPQVQRGAFEALVRSLREQLPGVQIIVFLDGCPECLRVKKIHLEVAAHYRLPVIDYAAMVSKYNKGGRTGGDAPDWLWPQKRGSKPGTQWPGFEPKYVGLPHERMTTSHPPWTVHEKISQVVAYSWVKMLEQACNLQQPVQQYWPSTTFMPAHVLGAFPTCASPVSYYSAATAFAEETRATSALPTVVSGDWQLFEDRKGKPGWIATKPDATIRFPIQVDTRGMREQHVLTISWLTSYEGVGNANAYLFPTKRPDLLSSPVFLGGHVSEKASQVTSGFFGIGPMYGVVCFIRRAGGEFIGHANYTLEIRLASKQSGASKFKIVEVTSC